MPTILGYPNHILNRSAEPDYLMECVPPRLSRLLRPCGRPGPLRHPGPRIF